MTDLLTGVTLTTSSAAVGASCSSWAPTVFDPANVNDGDDTSRSYRNSTVKNGPCTYQVIWTADLGTTESADGYRIVTSHIGYWSLEVASSPGGPWTAVATFDGVDGVDLGFGYEHVGAFDAEAGRYWRLVHAVDQPGLRFMQTVQLFTWELDDAGAAPPDPDPDPDPDEWIPPDPSRAIVEIYVNDPDGPRWDVAEWDEATWASAGWVAIDYLVTRVSVVDGTDQADRGILASPRASKFDCDTYDPDRHLDPNNPDSPFAGQLVAGLPIRLRHRSTVLRTARVRTVEYSHDLVGGRITASDLVTDLANATLPPTTILADTLYERATEAIAAVGLSFRVLPPTPAGDPALVEWEPAARSVWDVVTEAALSVLWWPYVTRDNELGFRPWADGVERGRVIAEDELIDLVSWSHDDGLYSAVRALDSVSATVEERAATPTPSYGRRVYTGRENVPTIDADAWAAAVLADRRDHQLRYRPGRIRPLTADSVETLGTVDILEGIDVLHPSTDPSVSFHARVLGRSVEAVDETHDPDEVRTRWRFAFATSAAPPTLLVADQDAALYLTDEADTDNLTTG